jgi:hypothetical protein
MTFQERAIGGDALATAFAGFCWVDFSVISEAQNYEFRRFSQLFMEII